MKNKSKRSSNTIVIANPSRTYFYSTAVNIITAAVILLAGIAAAAVIECIFYDYIKNGYGTTAAQIAVLQVCAVICAIPFVIWSVKIFASDCKIRRILKNGKCYEGKITSFSMFGVYKGTEIKRRGRTKNITLHIQYKMNKEHYCSVSGYARNPNKVLHDKTCRVYVYKNMVFVSGFKMRKKDEAKVLIPQEN